MTEQLVRMQVQLTTESESQEYEVGHVENADAENQTEIIIERLDAVTDATHFHLDIYRNDDTREHLCFPGHHVLWSRTLFVSCEEEPADDGISR